MTASPALAGPEPLPMYRIDSVVPVADPSGGSGEWFRYVIALGPLDENSIVGTRSGALADVNAQLDDMVRRLNERLGKLQAKKK
jgi:hypothetical protein